MKKKPPKSVRKYIRNKKAFIRKETLDKGKQKELINLIYKKYGKNNGN